MIRALALLLLAALLAVPALCPAQNLANPNEEVLQAPAPGSPEPAAPAPAQDQPYQPLLTMDALQKRLLYARLLIENGFHQRGLAEYRALRRDFPHRDDVRSAYVQTLLELDRLDQAEGLIRAWLAENPRDPQALRMAAELAMAFDQPAEAALYFEHLSRLRPRDPAALSDAAFARQQAGDEMRALRLFSESLDIDPDQPAAREAVRQALLARRPRLVGQASMLKQSGDAYTYAGGAGFSAMVLEGTRLEAAYDHVSVTRPQSDETVALDNSLDHGRLRLRQRLADSLDLRLGAGAFEGFKTGFSQEAGLDWRPLDWGGFSLDGKRNQPWYDEIDATRYRGSYNDAMVRFDGFVDNWGFYGEAGLRRYYLSPYNFYGTRYRFNGVVTRRLLDAPEVYVSYSYYRTSFKYRDEDVRPLDMVKNVAQHMFTASAAKRLSPWLRAVLAGGVGQDQFKTSPVFMVAPSLEASIGPRVEVTAGFEYRNESDRIGGGETLSANLGFRIVF